MADISTAKEPSCCDFLRPLLSAGATSQAGSSTPSPDATWRKMPVITEDDKPQDTKSRRRCSTGGSAVQLSWVDRLCGLGVRDPGLASKAAPRSTRRCATTRSTR